MSSDRREIQGSVVDQERDQLEALIRAVQVPSMTHDHHKGSCGRIAIVGGSEDYAGAPYLAAMASIRSGADLSYVFTTPSASPVVKGYSPDLVVRPLLDPTRSEELLAGLSRCHAAVVGPGLGVQSSALSLVKDVITNLIRARTPVVVDADALRVIEAHPTLLRDTEGEETPSNSMDDGPGRHAVVVLTPNAMELRRLAQSILPNGDSQICDVRSVEDTCLALARATGCFVLAKGQPDVVATPLENNPPLVTRNAVSGSLRRCAGQGDVLAGIIATFLAWTYLPSCQSVATSSAMESLINDIILSARGGSSTSPEFLRTHAAILGASTMMRLVQQATFSEPQGPGRCYIASDLLLQLPKVATKHLTETGSMLSK